LEKAAGRGDGLSIFHFLFWAIVVGAIMWTGETEASAAPLIEAKTAAAYDGAAVQVACVLIRLTMDSLGE
jgi:hypothetical protein